MQLVIGGAYSGKRNFVKQKKQSLCWISSYQGNHLDDWHQKWIPRTTLVLEGWEKWVALEIAKQEDDDTVREKFKVALKALKEEGLKRGEEIVLIMLETGRGIVPMTREDRRLRDLSGWLAQDAVEMSDEVFYIWHGIERRMK